MLTPAKVAEARRLLDRGQKSQREIARELEISRTTLRAIANGRRPDVVIDIPEEDPKCQLPPVRCRGCGGMVHAPCRVCRLRKLTAGRQSMTTIRSSERCGKVQESSNRNQSCQR
jgi:DNA-binding XRE family transcriptional regulator